MDDRLARIALITAIVGLLAAVLGLATVIIQAIA